jgi:hypothetical protein
LENCGVLFIAAYPSINMFDADHYPTPLMSKPSEKENQQQSCSKFYQETKATDPFLESNTYIEILESSLHYRDLLQKG